MLVKPVKNRLVIISHYSHYEWLQVQDAKMESALITSAHEVSSAQEGSHVRSSKLPDLSLEHRTCPLHDGLLLPDLGSISVEPLPDCQGRSCQSEVEETADLCHNRAGSPGVVWRGLLYGSVCHGRVRGCLSTG